MAVVRFQKSSSFILATFFTILLVCSVAIVIYLISLANSSNFSGGDIQAIKDTINALGILIIILLIIVLVVAYFVSVYVVSLINTISDTADDIMKSGDLSQRIPITHERDDLSKLARVLNSMFARIEELLAGVRQVSDNIAHDLRTPLARLRNKIEKFDGGAAEKEELMKEADTLINIFNALLRIARIEAGKETARFKKLDISSLAKDVVELYEPLAEEKQQTIKLSISHAQIVGDKDLLFQALANLLDNAIKFSPKGGKIKISSSVTNGFYVVKISDSGTGIAKEERDKVFTRFYRSESSRNKAGHGLGLSLVKAVVEAHKGKIEILNSKTGLSMALHLPSVR